MYITTGFLFLFCWEGGGNFYLLCSQTPSCQHILLNLVLSSSYTLYYQFWYNYIYKYKIIYKGLFETNPWQRWCLIHCEWMQHWTVDTDLGQSLLWQCWNIIKTSLTWSVFQPTWEPDSLICLLRVLDGIKKIYFLNNVISNLKTAPDSLHLRWNNWQITSGSVGGLWPFGSNKTSSRMPSICVNYGYMLTLLFLLSTHENMVFCISNSGLFPDLCSCLRYS